MTQIIQEHSKRVNGIVENVLQLSRRSPSNPEEFDIQMWLTLFADEFARIKQLDAKAIRLSVSPSRITARFDTSQLHQVMWNLCDNGLRHTLPQPDGTLLELRGGIQQNTQTPYIEIRDFGPGLAPSAAEHVFEPFFTTEIRGTGLGLYISRELCECNQAQLNVMPGREPGACFRISFADTRRSQLTG